MKTTTGKSLFLLAVILGSCIAATCCVAPVEVVDDAGKTIQINTVPHYIVSLVPSATEIIYAIGGGDNLVGITHHSSAVQGAGHTAIVGGFLSPSVQKIWILHQTLSSFLITVFKPPVPVWLGPRGSEGAICIVTRDMNKVGDAVKNNASTVRGMLGLMGVSKPVSASGSNLPGGRQ